MTSQAVIVAVRDSTVLEDGASKPDDSVPIRISGDLYEEVLSDPKIWDGNVTRLPDGDLDNPQAVLDRIRQAANLTGSGERLLVIYVGHGQNFSGEVFLATRSAHINRREGWISINALYDAMTGQLENRQVAAGLKMLIADACHTGAIRTLGAGTDHVETTPADDFALPGFPKITEPGTFVLTSANRKQPNPKFTPCDYIGDPGDPARMATPFSGHMVKIIRDGLAAEEPYFTAVGLHDALREAMRTCPTAHIDPDHDGTPSGRTSVVLRNRKGRDTPADAGSAPAPLTTREWWVEHVLSGAAGKLPELARQPADCATIMVDAARRSADSQDGAQQQNVLTAQRILLDQLAAPASVTSYLTGLKRKVPDQGHDLWWLVDDAFHNILDVPVRGDQPVPPAGAFQRAGEAADFAALLQALRSGGEGALAVEVLHMFGMMHKVDQLPQLVRTFSTPLDRVLVLTAAALNRKPQDAARLVILLGRENDGEAIASIVHDVACQRTVPDVMTFLRGVREHPEIVRSVLTMFTGESSGRSDFDKVQLCSALRADVHFRSQEREHEYAHQVLGRALHVAYRRDHRSDAPRDVERARLDDIPAALHHVDRDLETLRTWILTELNRNDTPDLYADIYAEDQRRTTVDEIAAWAVTHSPNRAAADELIHFAVKDLPAQHVGVICEQLADPGKAGKRGGAAGGGQFHMLRRAFAAHATTDKIGDLLRQLDEFSPLNDESDALLTEIVLNGGPGNEGAFRPVASLGTICEKLSGSRNQALASALRRIALGRLGGRPARDVPALVELAGSARERRRLERLAGAGVAAATLDATAPAAERTAWCVDVLQTLERAGLSLAVTFTLRGLSEPGRFDNEAAERIAAVAQRIGRAPELEKQAFYLLERTLENEQGGRGTQQRDVVTRTVTIINAVATWLPRPRRQELVQATVGRWSDTHLRYETARGLTGIGDVDAASWIYEVLERR
ncbi:hypothetical protein [Actinomadura sp. 3N508]|uniref:hypothetical protein n=1 Tax=Actinomadura sp. 3N508 TaxID=3375153 RepID=UPI00378EFC28